LRRDLFPQKNLFKWNAKPPHTRGQIAQMSRAAIEIKKPPQAKNKKNYFLITRNILGAKTVETEKSKNAICYNGRSRQ
jgi:hypothetical protein